MRTYLNGRWRCSKTLQDLGPLNPDIDADGHQQVVREQARVRPVHLVHSELVGISRGNRIGGSEEPAIFSQSLPGTRTTSGSVV